MADRSQQTEQATPRRLEKAREEGRYPVSREALSTVAFAVTTLLVIRLLPDALDRFAELLRLTVSKAFSHRFSVRTALGLWHSIALGSFVPMLLAGAATLALVIGAQLAMTGFGMAGSRLTLDWNRLNPLPRLRELPAQNLWQVVQALAVLGVFAALLAIQMRDWIPAMLLLPLQPFRTALASVSETMVSLLYKAIFLFAILGAIDLIRQRAKYSRDLRMSKQEIREEVKESDGNPHVKQKIRRLQRDASRRRMMEKVPQATAVIVIRRTSRWRSSTTRRAWPRRKWWPKARTIWPAGFAKSRSRTRCRSSRIRRWRVPSTSPSRWATRFRPISIGPSPKCWPTSSAS